MIAMKLSSDYFYKENDSRHTIRMRMRMKIIIIKNKKLIINYKN